MVGEVVAPPVVDGVADRSVESGGMWWQRFSVLWFTFHILPVDLETIPLGFVFPQKMYHRNNSGVVSSSTEWFQNSSKSANLTA